MFLNAICNSVATLPGILSVYFELLLVQILFIEL